MSTQRRQRRAALQAVTESSDLAETYRRMTVRQAMEMLNDSDVYYRDTVVRYLYKACEHASRLDNRPVSFEDVRAHLAASYALLGHTVRAPFATQVAQRLLQQGDR